MYQKMISKNSKKTIARFTNRKIVKDALYKRKQLKNIDKAALEMQNAMLFLNENLSEENKKIAFLCRKLKRGGVISSTYTQMELFDYHAKVLKMGGSKRFLISVFCWKVFQALILVWKIMKVIMWQMCLFSPVISEWW